MALVPAKRRHSSFVRSRPAVSHALRSQESTARFHRVVFPSTVAVINSCVAGMNVMVVWRKSVLSGIWIVPSLSPDEGFVIITVPSLRSYAISAPSALEAKPCS